MIHPPEIQHLRDAFDVQGFVVINADEVSRRWAAEALTMANAQVAKSAPRDGWYDLHLGMPLPRSPQLEALLRELLVTAPAMPQGAQLSTLVEGFERPGNHRHVDGYYTPPGKAMRELAWHALLIGVLIVDLPEHGDAGNPLVWPGSHHLMRRAFNSLGLTPSKEDVGRIIENAHSVGSALQPVKLHGPAGTIFVMDHDLQHGMQPHRMSPLVRHIAYYRVPDRTSDPAHVINRSHFFRSS